MDTYINKDKLKKVIRSIKDPDIQEIISDVIDTERYHRSLDDVPITEIIQIIENKAMEIERKDRGIQPL